MEIHILDFHQIWKSNSLNFKVNYFLNIKSEYETESAEFSNVSFKTFNFDIEYFQKLLKLSSLKI